MYFSSFFFTISWCSCLYLGSLHPRILSTSIYDLVLIYVCHFHWLLHKSTLTTIEILVLSSWIPASKEFYYKVQSTFSNVIATSLNEGEAVEKKIAIVTVFGDNRGKSTQIFLCVTYEIYFHISFFFFPPFFRVWTNGFIFLAFFSTSQESMNYPSFNIF